MPVIIKTNQEIEKLRIAGKRLADVVLKVSQKVAPGVTTKELDSYAEELIRGYGDEPAFKGYQPEGADFPFPSTLCTSVNEGVVHGLPNDEPLQEGDIVSIDCGLKHEGVFADHAVTVPVGTITPTLTQLLADTKTAMQRGIAAAQPGFYTGDIGHAIESFVNDRYGIVRILAGHGVGRHIHEDPYIPNFGKLGTGVPLQPGMVIAIEPMLNMGTEEVLLTNDGYTFITQDKKPSAHFEHTVLITPEGPEILTKI